MSSIVTKKINNIKVKAVPVIHPPDTRPVLGEKLFSIVNSNTFMCAKRGSGKTSVIYKAIDECANKDTKVIAISGSMNNDKSWLAIQRLCEKKKISLETYTSIWDDEGDNVLEILTNKLKALNEGKETEEEEEDGFSGSLEESLEFVPTGGIDIFGMPTKGSGPSKSKKRRSKYQSPAWLLILDDIPNELKNSYVTAALKLFRHWGKIIISSQSVNDLSKSGRNQLDYVILFRGMPVEKLEEIWRACALPITMDQFEAMYNFATREKYQFLYVDTANNEYRKNFSEMIEIPPPIPSLKRRR
ncbi:MAG: hypothetical protein PHG66_06295 [Candidatus Colwellbacteria bacterium]|nr:hypothetical protein [Candidatus Colwellbacteria bacterium]